MPPVSLALHAMATRFEIVLHGDHPVALRAAGEEALEEVERLEAQLSLFRPSSEIAHLNARAATEPVRVTPGLFALLQHAHKLHQESGGAFDITIAPLVRCWGFMGGSGHIPSLEALAEAREKVGMHLVQLDPKNFTVRFARTGVMLDLGAIGKGYAIERAAELLREAGVTSALLHGGTSTVYALGHPPEAEFWKVAIEQATVRRPERRVSSRQGEHQQAGSGSETSNVRRLTTPLPIQPGIAAINPGQQDARPALLATVPLRDEALSVSAVWGKFFETEGKAFGHILDPRTGQPASQALLAAVVLPSATETDALSTALLTRGSEGHEQIAGLRPGIRTLLAVQDADHFRCEARNFILG